MVGVAHESDGLVTGRGQLAFEVLGDLAVSSGDGDPHAPTVSTDRLASPCRVSRCGCPQGRRGPCRPAPVLPRFGPCAGESGTRCPRSRGDALSSSTPSSRGCARARSGARSGAAGRRPRGVLDPGAATAGGSGGARRACAGARARSPCPGRRAGPGYRVPGWLADRVPAALRGRVGLSGQHGVVVLALVGLALAVAGWLAVRSGAHADAVPPPRLVTTGGSATAEASPAVPAATAASAAATGQVVVDVAGKVRRPGIVTLPAGSRVQDAIRRAGGPRPGVVLTSLNLARLLVDGEQVLVGQPVVPGRRTQCRGRVTRRRRAGQPQLRPPCPSSTRSRAWGR